MRGDDFFFDGDSRAAMCDGCSGTWRRPTLASAAGVVVVVVIVWSAACRRWLCTR
jgi:hypothetical protein